MKHKNFRILKYVLIFSPIGFLLLLYLILSLLFGLTTPEKSSTIPDSVEELATESQNQDLDSNNKSDKEAILSQK